MPDELYEQVKNEIEKDIGVYSYNGHCLYLKKKARKQKLIEGMNEQLYYGMVRSLNREREKQRNKIETFYYRQLNEYKSKLHNEIKEKNSQLWKLKHNKECGNIKQQIEIDKLDIEIDILENVYRNLIIIN